MPESVYVEVEECVVELRAAGFEDHADALETTLFGSTSGEILTDLALCLSKIVEPRDRAMTGLDARMRQLLKRVEGVLLSAGWSRSKSEHLR